MKAAIYCRVSRDSQEITTQEKICLEFCQRAGHEVYKVYSDTGISGMADSRPAFNELLIDMRHYKFDCIVVTKLDRMGRSLQHLLNLFDEFNGKGVHFIAATQNIDTSSPTGKLFMHITGAFAEYERNLISERTKEGLKYSPNAHLVGKRGPDLKPRKLRGTLREKIR